MEQGIENLQLIIEVYGPEGDFEDEWEYEVTRDSLESWEAADMLNPDEGKTLVRYLLFSRLRENSPLIWNLLTSNTSLSEFMREGVPSSIVAEIPRLSIVNFAVDRMYDCLSELVLEEEIRVAH